MLSNYYESIEINDLSVLEILRAFFTLIFSVSINTKSYHDNFVGQPIISNSIQVVFR